MPQDSKTPPFRKKLPKTKIALAIAFGLSCFVPFLLSAVGLFLSLWIVVPAPILSLLPLGVGAPEVSPWLIGLNMMALVLAWQGFSKSGWFSIALGISGLSLVLSLLPLVQLPAANNRMNIAMQAALGVNYLDKLPQEVKETLRPHPFVLMDVFRGIPEQPIRSSLGIPFASIDDVTLRLNVYRPLQVGKYPAIVVVYGGAWQRGTPDNDAAFSHYMASRGYTVVAIDYRHAPQYRFPAQLQDVQTALTFVQQHAEEYEIDRDRIAIMGRSAGAHLAMLAAYQPGTVPLQAVVNYYGPVDLTKGYYDLPKPDPINSRAVLQGLLGGTPEEFPELYRAASPINAVQPGRLPSLLIYAGRDHLVQAKFGRFLYEKLIATGNRAVFLEIPWAEHAFDAVFNGVSNQLALYYTERFLAQALK